jgi:hypothetical protein
MRGSEKLKKIMGDNNRGERLEFLDKQRIDDKLAYSG